MKLLTLEESLAKLLDAVQAQAEQDKAIILKRLTATAILRKKRGDDERLEN